MTTVWSRDHLGACTFYMICTFHEEMFPLKLHLIDYEINAHKYWNNFYKIHENGFFKDRHWLFTEFPELAPSQNQNHLKDWFLENKRSEVPECRNNEDGPSLIMEEQHKCSSKSLEHKTETPPVEENVTQKISDLEICADEFPGSSATYRILEVGCGVGNTVFPILQTNNDPGLFVYCCDFSSTAIELVQTNPEYDPSRCFAFVHDLCDEEKSYPVPKGSLDIIILIFVLSAIVPDKMQKAINRLSRLLKPGGMMLLRDYGRYDMAQLRFKKGQCLSGNFYVRGDGTRVYFFTQGAGHAFHHCWTGKGSEPGGPPTASEPREATDNVPGLDSVQILQAPSVQHQLRGTCCQDGASSLCFRAFLKKHL
ncbi:PREDICTED: methyltransferase-like protein 2A isoform X2 [Cercocebus atys]|uniref:methyltransferase-like protein 2A isoform X2 n=1 Tax=Cercocebus atys TaxID=9531 RepID=UPI0005F3CA66|nr:PREDICTED: methyltransferase-like protein 2A isoform X2 [Cercocebus atys]